MIDSPDQSASTLPEGVEARMREILARHANDYRQDLPRLIAQMQTYAARAGDADWRDSLSPLKREAHDMKGQAATFGFPELSAVSHSLCRLLEHASSDHADYAPAVQAHVAALSALLAGSDPALVTEVTERAQRLIEKD